MQKKIYPVSKDTGLSLTFVSIIVLQVFAMTSNSWHVVTINVNECLYCGTVTAAVGRLFDDADDYHLDIGRQYPSDDMEDTTFSTELNSSDNDSYDSSSIIVNDIDAFRNDSTSIIVNDIDAFGIGTYIFIYIGLWRTSFCNTGGFCVDVSARCSRDILGSVTLLKQMQDSVLLARVPFVMSLLIMCTALADYGYDLAVGRSLKSMKSKWPKVAGFFSAVFLLISAATATFPLLRISCFQDVIEPRLPWAQFSVITAVYLTLVIIYNLHRAERQVKQTALCYWNRRHYLLV